MTDSSGNVAERYSYDVYGAPIFKNASGGTVSTSASGNRFLFTGREYVQQIALYDYRNRMYSPSFGRFLQADPLRFDASDFNLYRYVYDNPTGWVDPEGLKAENSRVVCDGKNPGGFTSELNGNAGGPAAPCIQDHEDSHLDDYRNGPYKDACKGVKKGAIPPIKDPNYKNWLNQSECKAYRSEIACDKKELDKCRLSSMAAKREQISNAMQDAKQNANSKYGCQLQ